MTLAQIPNLLCILRIVLAVPVVILLVQGDYRLALWVFAFAGFTDGLDGFLAKRFGWVSWLGGVLDPTADKLLLVSAFLALTFLGLIPLWLAVAVVARDVIIVSGAAAYHFTVGRYDAEPTQVSKLNSVLQMLLVIAVVAHAGYDWPSQSVVIALGAGVFVTTAVSGMDYMWIWGRRAWQMAHGGTTNPHT